MVTKNFLSAIFSFFMLFFVQTQVSISATFETIENVSNIADTEKESEKMNWEYFALALFLIFEVRYW